MRSGYSLSREEGSGGQDRRGQAIAPPLAVGRLHREHPAPFAARERVVVAARQAREVGIGGPCAGAGLRRGCRIAVVEAVIGFGVEQSDIGERGGGDGIVDQLEERIPAVGGDARRERADAGGERVERGEAGGDLGRRKRAGARQLAGQPPLQMLGPPREVETVMLGQDRRGVRRDIGAERAGRPLADDGVDRLRACGRHVPRQSQEIVGGEFARLEIADIGDPHLPRAGIPGAAQFLADQRGRGGRQPQIRQRRAEIGEVVIDARSAGSLAFGGVGEVADIAEIVVGPQQRDVARHLQPAAIDVEHFLIRGEHLRRVLRQHSALVGEDALEQRPASGIVARADHPAVVDAAHAERPNALVARVGRHPLAPVARDTGSVGDVIEALRRRGPFADIVAQHRLGMARAHHDRIAIGERCVAGVGIERARHLVHRRPDEVGLEPQHQFEQLGVGFRADRARRGLEGVRGPGLQPPILVVEENAAILDRGRTEARDACGRAQQRMVFGRDVRPPMPRRHADRARQFVGAECGAAAVAADDHQRRGDAGGGAIDRGDHEAFPRAAQLADVEQAAPREAVDRGVAAERAEPDLRTVAGRRARHAGEIGREVGGGDPYHRMVARVGHHARDAARIRQHDARPGIERDQRRLRHCRPSYAAECQKERERAGRAAPGGPTRRYAVEAGKRRLLH